MAPFLVTSTGMTDRRRHRVSLMLAFVGALLMLAAAAERAWPRPFDATLPSYESSRPPLPDWPRLSRGTRV